MWTCGRVEEWNLNFRRWEKNIMEEVEVWNEDMKKVDERANSRRWRKRNVDLRRSGKSTYGRTEGVLWRQQPDRGRRAGVAGSWVMRGRACGRGGGVRGGRG